MSYQHEIERKFIVISDNWRTFASASIKIQQGYLSTLPDHTVRVRTEGTVGRLNIKICQHNNWSSREEFEYTIPFEEAQLLLNSIPSTHITKTRWPVMHAGKYWEVDVFEGENTGLVTAEIELKSISEKFEKPQWIGEEVTQDKRYYNVSLGKKPYISWS